MGDEGMPPSPAADQKGTGPTQFAAVLAPPRLLRLSLWAAKFIFNSLATRAAVGCGNGHPSLQSLAPPLRTHHRFHSDRVAHKKLRSRPAVLPCFQKYFSGKQKTRILVRGHTEPVRSRLAG